MESIVSLLEFVKVTGAMDSFMCHMCTTKHSEQWQVASINCFEDETGDIMLIVCSDNCKQKLLEFEKIELALGNMILDIAAKTNQKLTKEFEQYIFAL